MAVFHSFGTGTSPDLSVEISRFCFKNRYENVLMDMPFFNSEKDGSCIRTCSSEKIPGMYCHI